MEDLDLITSVDDKEIEQILRFRRNIGYILEGDFIKNTIIETIQESDLCRFNRDRIPRINPKRIAFSLLLDDSKIPEKFLNHKIRPSKEGEPLKLNDSTYKDVCDTKIQAVGEVLYKITEKLTKHLDERWDTVKPYIPKNIDKEDAYLIMTNIFAAGCAPNYEPRGIKTSNDIIVSIRAII